MLASLAIALVLGPQTLEITFVRHAETVANATGTYNSRTLNTLSEKGKGQVASLTPRLQAMGRFDAVVASPAGRCLQTVGPYLRLTRQKAEIWPELLECCQQPRAQRGEPAGPVRFAGKVQIPDAWADVFVTVPGKDRTWVEGNYNEGIRMVRAAADRLRGMRGRVLVVGHSAHGGRLFRELLGKESGIKVENATPYRFQIGSDGIARRIKLQ